MKMIYWPFILLFFSTFAQAWTSTPVLRCLSQNESNPFRKLEIVQVQRASQFFVVRIFDGASNYYYESFTSVPTQHRKVIGSSYQTYSSRDKMRFELMLHIETKEAYIFFESTQQHKYNTVEGLTDFKCEILAPRLISISTR